jgi:hypothetical protein
MNDIRYADGRRIFTGADDFPRRWGPIPPGNDARQEWIRENARKDQATRQAAAPFLAESRAFWAEIDGPEPSEQEKRRRLAARRLHLSLLERVGEWV